MQSLGNPQAWRRPGMMSQRMLAVAMLGLLGCASSLIAQTPLRSAAAGPQKPSATLPAAAPAQVAPTPEIEKPPSQAEIRTTPDSLTISATNASLTQTLQRIADKTGMKLEGVSGDERIFGSFGPGEPRDVISSLLNGTSYNVVMVGSLDNGAPRRLLLSIKSSTAAPAPSAPAPPPADDDSADVPQDDPPPQSMPPPGRPMGQGLGGIRNPQDMLQQMRQQQQQQAGGPPPQ